MLPVCALAPNPSLDIALRAIYAYPLFCKYVPGRTRSHKKNHVFGNSLDFANTCRGSVTVLGCEFLTYFKIMCHFLRFFAAKARSG
jgi:hypothetical protein